MACMEVAVAAAERKAGGGAVAGEVRLARGSLVEKARAAGCQVVGAEVEQEAEQWAAMEAGGCCGSSRCSRSRVWPIART